MRTLRLSLVGTVILVLLGGLGGLVTGQESQAPDATPIAGDGVTVDTLTQVTIAASDLPESVDSILLVHLRLPGESTSIWMHENTAAQISYVLEGELQAPVTGRTEIIHANGDLEALDTGVALGAEPGDTVIGYDLTLPKVYANSAATPVDWLGSVFAHGGWGVNDIPLVETGSALEFPGGDWLTPYDFGEAGLTGRPLLVTIRRVTLEPGAKIEVEDRYAAVRLIEGGVVTRTPMENGAPTASPIRMSSTIPYVRPEPGSVIELSNQGSESAMFYELAVEPASSE